MRFSVGEVEKEPLASHECAWEKQINYAGISAYYCGYQRSHRWKQHHGDCADRPDVSHHQAVPRHRIEKGGTVSCAVVVTGGGLHYEWHCMANKKNVKVD